MRYAKSPAIQLWMAVLKGDVLCEVPCQSPVVGFVKSIPMPFWLPPQWTVTTLVRPHARAMAALSNWALANACVDRPPAGPAGRIWQPLPVDGGVTVAPKVIS